MILRSCLDKNLSIIRCIVTMLRRFMVKEEARKYTAVRKSTKNEKLPFNTTEFYKCILGMYGLHNKINSFNI